MRNFLKVRKKNEDEKRFFNLFNYFLIHRDLTSIKMLLSTATSDFKIPNLEPRLRNLFLRQERCNDMFFLGADIVSVMKHMTFAGNVEIKTDKVRAQKEIDKLFYNGQFLDILKKAYEYALSSVNGRSFVFLQTNPTYEIENDFKIGDKFLRFEVFHDYEIEIEDNKLERKFFIPYVFDKEKGEEEFIEVKYEYITEDNFVTRLNITGTTEKGNRVPDDLLKELLSVDVLVDVFNFVPYEILHLGKGMLDNILFIEDELAKVKYFKKKDLPNAQTRKYIPSAHMNRIVTQDGFNQEYEDEFRTTFAYQGGVGLSTKDQVVIVDGKSSIDFIEKHILMTISEACLNAEISPASLPYAILDKVSNNTEIGVNKERLSIRTRNNNVNKIVMFAAHLLSKFLELNGHNVSYEEITVNFDDYITPSIESMTNVLSKQVQFGIKSRKRAIYELNRGEMTDNELEQEYKEVLQASTQQDYNVRQAIQQENENVNKIDNKENNVLKSDGIEE